mmetsp:Transcript_10103/g.28400  ORF Transcript_10103/g.28400 Transcript_10103/m.28400 type:complete len:211 (-) Transcript_10103:164-796(-)
MCTAPPLLCIYQLTSNHCLSSWSTAMASSYFISWYWPSFRLWGRRRLPTRTRLRAARGIPAALASSRTSCFLPSPTTTLTRYSRRVSPVSSPGMCTSSGATWTPSTSQPCTRSLSWRCVILDLLVMTYSFVIVCLGWVMRCAHWPSLVIRMSPVVFTSKRPTVNSRGGTSASGFRARQRLSQDSMHRYTVFAGSALSREQMSPRGLLTMK